MEGPSGLALYRSKPDWESLGEFSQCLSRGFPLHLEYLGTPELLKQKERMLPAVTVVALFIGTVTTRVRGFATMLTCLSGIN